MEIVVKGRHTEVAERFRRHCAEKLAKVERLDSKVIRIDVEVSREHNPRLADRCERVELTVRSKGPVVRAEACADDPYAALDVAYSRLEARLRKAADRRRVHHGSRTPVSVAAATASLPEPDLVPPSGARLNGSAAGGASPVGGPTSGTALDVREARTSSVAGLDGDLDSADLAAPEVVAGLAVDGECPMVIREKVHQAVPMSLEQALYEMELVGHDFFLFVDADTRRPSVVYRRRGYDYGVIRLDVAGEAAPQ